MVSNWYKQEETTRVVRPKIYYRNACVDFVFRYAAGLEIQTFLKREYEYIKREREKNSVSGKMFKN